MGAADLPANAADEVHEHDVGAAAADLQAEGIDGIGIEPHRHGGLADLAAHRLAAHQQALGLQHAHDDGDGLGGQAAAPGDIGLRQAAVPTHQRHDQPLVIGAHAHLVGAPARVEDFGRRGGCRRGMFAHRLLPCRSRRGAPFPVLLSAAVPLFHRKRCSRGFHPFFPPACHIELIIQFDLFIDRHFFWWSFHPRKHGRPAEEPLARVTGWPGQGRIPFRPWED